MSPTDFRSGQCRLQEHSVCQEIRGTELSPPLASSRFAPPRPVWTCSVYWRSAQHLAIVLRPDVSTEYDNRPPRPKGVRPKTRDAYWRAVRIGGNETRRAGSAFDNPDSLDLGGLARGPHNCSTNLELSSEGAGLSFLSAVQTGNPK